MAEALTVRKVENARDFKAFFEFPWTVYKNDPNWVPPLLSQRRHLLDKKKNPSWKYLTGDYFVAWRGNQAVGTIAAFINHRHNETWEEKMGWFGCFEVLEDQEAATALLRTAAEHVRSLGAEAIRGPASFTLNDECGLLIDNFEPPLVLMPYNHPYYKTLIECSGLGYEKVMDTISFFTGPGEYLDASGQFPEKLLRVVRKTKERAGIVTRQADVKRLKEELALLREIYQSAWEKNWGFVPPTDHEMDDLFANLRQYFDARLGTFATVNGELAGFIMALPDMNQVLHRAYPRPGTPEIWTLLKALWHWKIRPKITRQRVMLMGVKPQFRRKGVDAALFLAHLELSKDTPFPPIDAGWILEINDAAKTLAKTFGAYTYKQYRFFQKAL